MNATDLRNFFDECCRLAGQVQAIKERYALLREAATKKGIDWSQLKALATATVVDASEDTDKRVRRLIEKADFASAYADMLALRKDERKTQNRSFSQTPPQSKVSRNWVPAQPIRKSQLAASTGPAPRGDEAAPRVPSGVASPIPDESRANARDEAMPQDSPQGVGKVERASRLVTGRTVAPGRDGRTPVPISPVRDAEPTIAPQHNETRRPLVVGADGRTGSAPLPTGASSEAAPALGDAFRTDATSSRFAVSTQQVTSLPDGGNLAGEPRASSGGVPGHLLFATDAISQTAPQPMLKPVSGPKAGHSLSETDAAIDNSIVGPAVTEDSSPWGSLAAGSPISGSRGGVEGHAASTPECLRLDSHQLTARGLSGEQDVRQSGERPGLREADTDPSLDIRNQPFYRGGETWPR